MEFLRFNETELVQSENQTTYGLWVRPDFVDQESLQPNDVGFFNITSATEGRPDIISHQIYGTPFLDWVIIAFNSPENTLNWPEAGETIKYPVKRVVLSRLL